MPPHSRLSCPGPPSWPGSSRRRSRRGESLPSACRLWAGKRRRSFDPGPREFASFSSPGSVRRVMAASTASGFELRPSEPAPDLGRAAWPHSLRIERPGHTLFWPSNQCRSVAISLGHADWHRPGLLWLRHREAKWPWAGLGDSVGGSRHIPHWPECRNVPVAAGWPWSHRHRTGDWDVRAGAECPPGTPRQARFANERPVSAIRQQPRPVMVSRRKRSKALLAELPLAALLVRLRDLLRDRPGFLERDWRASDARRPVRRRWAASTGLYSSARHACPARTARAAAPYAGEAQSQEEEQCVCDSAWFDWPSPASWLACSRLPCPPSSRPRRMPARSTRPPAPSSSKKPGFSPYAGRNYPTRVYWGDTHLHTSMSLDARAAGNTLGPEEALRFARGEEVVAATGEPAKLVPPAGLARRRRPLRRHGHDERDRQGQPAADDRSRSARSGTT